MRDRNRLRATFDEYADLYDEVRPIYPEQLIEDIIELSAIPPAGRILEIGCGTGQATKPFAERRYEILCVELGSNLATVARKNLGRYPNVEIRVQPFEKWEPPLEAFDLVVAATVLRWLDPEVRYAKPAAVLGPGGSLAIFGHQQVRLRDDDGFFEAVQPIYERYAESRDFALPYPEDLRNEVEAELTSSGLFETVVVRKYPWTETYDTERYLKLLNTFSDHIALPPERRELLLTAIGEFIESEYGGRVTKHFIVVLNLARKPPF